MVLVAALQLRRVASVICRLARLVAEPFDLVMYKLARCWDRVGRVLSVLVVVGLLVVRLTKFILFVAPLGLLADFALMEFVVIAELLRFLFAVVVPSRQLAGVTALLCCVARLLPDALKVVLDPFSQHFQCRPGDVGVRVIIVVPYVELMATLVLPVA